MMKKENRLINFNGLGENPGQMGQVDDGDLDKLSDVLKGLDDNKYSVRYIASRNLAVLLRKNNLEVLIKTVSKFSDTQSKEVQIRIEPCLKKLDSQYLKDILPGITVSQAEKLLKGAKGCESFHKELLRSIGYAGECVIPLLVPYVKDPTPAQLQDPNSDCLLAIESLGKTESPRAIPFLLPFTKEGMSMALRDAVSVAFFSIETIDANTMETLLSCLAAKKDIRVMDNFIDLAFIHAHDDKRILNVFIENRPDYPKYKLEGIFSRIREGFGLLAVPYFVTGLNGSNYLLIKKELILMGKEAIPSLEHELQNKNYDEVTKIGISNIIAQLDPDNAAKFDSFLTEGFLEVDKKETRPLSQDIYKFLKERGDQFLPTLEKQINENEDKPINKCKLVSLLQSIKLEASFEFIPFLVSILAEREDKENFDFYEPEVLLANCGGKAVPVLLETLEKDTTKTEAIVSIFKLNGLFPEQSIPLLIQRLDRDMSIYGTFSLIKEKYMLKTAPVAIKLLDSPDEQVRINAINVLQGLAGYEVKEKIDRRVFDAVPIIEKLFKNGSPRQRIYAASTLFSFNRDRSEHPGIESLQNIEIDDLRKFISDFFAVNSEARLNRDDLDTIALLYAFRAEKDPRPLLLEYAKKHPESKEDVDWVIKEFKGWYNP